MSFKKYAVMAMSAGLAGCSGGCGNGNGNGSGSGTTVQTPDFCESGTSMPTNIHDALVIHKSAHDGVFSAGVDFSFSRTIDAILESEGITSSQFEREAFVTSLLESFGNTARTNSDSNIPMNVTARLNETPPALTAAELLTAGSGMEPVAFFNRFDLAPADWEDCGEHRIVYALQNGGPFFLIFEGILPNPKHPSNTTPGNEEPGFEGCRPALDMWNSMTDTGTSDLEKAQTLETFYFGGLGDYSRIVRSEHYGSTGGQIRSNTFRSSPWELREWHTGFDFNTGNLVPKSVTVKDNIFPGFYNNGHPAGHNLLEGEFQTALINDLVAADSLPDDEFITSFGAGIENQFNSFKSDAQSTNDDPRAQAQGSPTLAASINNELAANHGTLNLTADHVLNRMGVLTCGGCHQFSGNSGNKALGPAPHQVWPTKDLSFVHVESDGRISNVLTDTLLPARAKGLETTMCTVQTAALPTRHTQFAQASDGAVPATTGDLAKKIRNLSSEMGELRENRERFEKLGITGEDAKRGEELRKNQRAISQKAREIDRLSRELRAKKAAKEGALYKHRRTH